MIRDRLSGRFVVIRLRTALESLHSCGESVECGARRGKSERDLTLRQSHQQYSLSCLQLWWSTSGRRRESWVWREFFPGKGSSVIFILRRYYRRPRNSVALVSPFSPVFLIPPSILYLSTSLSLSLPLHHHLSYRAYCETVWNARADGQRFREAGLICEREWPNVPLRIMWNSDAGLGSVARQVSWHIAPWCTATAFGKCRNHPVRVLSAPRQRPLPRTRRGNYFRSG